MSLIQYSIIQVGIKLDQFWSTDINTLKNEDGYLRHSCGILVRKSGVEQEGDYNSKEEQLGDYNTQRETDPVPFTFLPTT